MSQITDQSGRTPSSGPTNPNSNRSRETRVLSQTFSNASLRPLIDFALGRGPPDNVGVPNQTDYEQTLKQRTSFGPLNAIHEDANQHGGSRSLSSSLFGSIRRSVNRFVPGLGTKDHGVTEDDAAPVDAATADDAAAIAVNEPDGNETSSEKTLGPLVEPAPMVDNLTTPTVKASKEDCKGQSGTSNGQADNDGALVGKPAKRGLFFRRLSRTGKGKSAKNDIDQSSTKEVVSSARKGVPDSAPRLPPLTETRVDRNDSRFPSSSSLTKALDFTFHKFASQENLSRPVSCVEPLAHPATRSLSATLDVPRVVVPSSHDLNRNPRAGLPADIMTSGSAEPDRNFQAFLSDSSSDFSSRDSFDDDNVNPNKKSRPSEPYFKGKEARRLEKEIRESIDRMIAGEQSASSEEQQAATRSEQTSSAQTTDTTTAKVNVDEARPPAPVVAANRAIQPDAPPAGKYAGRYAAAASPGNWKLYPTIARNVQPGGVPPLRTNSDNPVGPSTPPPPAETEVTSPVSDSSMAEAAREYRIVPDVCRKASAGGSVDLLKAAADIRRARQATPDQGETTANPPASDGGFRNKLRRRLKGRGQSGRFE